MNPYPLNPTLGTIPENKIPGRDREIIQLLRLLRTQSVTVEEMRRMGKTLMLKKLAYLCNNDQLDSEFEDDNFKAKYFSFQGSQNLGEVIDLIMNGLEDFKAWYNVDFTKTYNFIRGLFSTPNVEIAGAKFSLNLPEFKKSWKEIFFSTLDDIANAQGGAEAKLILIFDELPIMLWEWYKDGKQEDALEFLDILRERRQALEKKGIRFVYCGSIGIRVVLDTFRSEFRYTGEPTNEMAEFDLKPFSEEESNFLCECFLLSKFNVDQEKAACLKLLFEMSNGLPFQLSKMFNIIQTEFDYDVSLANIKAAYEIILNDPKQHGTFKQLIDRLDIYYPKEKAKEMKKLLNELSKEDGFLSEEELHVRTQIEDIESVKSNLYVLLGDHYLLRRNEPGKRSFKFKYPIFQTWWRINIA